MGLGDFFKKLGKGVSKGGEEATPSPDEAPGGSKGRGRRFPNLNLPGWSKKGNAFVRKDMGMMKPPVDMAEEASIKRPDSWLKKRIGAAGETDEQERLDKLQQNAKPGTSRKKTLSDEDIEHFLSDVLGEGASKDEDGGEDPNQA